MPTTRSKKSKAAESPEKEEKSEEMAEEQIPTQEISIHSTSTPKDSVQKAEEHASNMNRVFLVYPFEEPTVNRIEITHRDLSRLQPGSLLNDNIIDFYLQYSWRHLSFEQQEQVYIFSSHFFTQLTRKENGQALTEGANLEHVVRWVRKDAQLFKKRLLFLPINDSFHWSIAVICNPGSAFEYKRHLSDQLASTNRLTKALDAHQEAYPPCILFLDSLDCHHKEKFCSLMRSYLEMEFQLGSSAECLPIEWHRDASKSEEKVFEVLQFDASKLTVVSPNIPMQSNQIDCGVFILMYANAIFRGLLSTGMTKQHLENSLAQVFSSTMFDSSRDVLIFREYLQQLLHSLRALKLQKRSESEIADEDLEFIHLK